MSLFHDTSASDAAKNARAVINKVKIPSLEEARAQLEQYVQQGIITPQQAETVLQEQTQYRQIEEDPRLRGSQIDALNELDGIVSNGGMDARLKASLYDIGAEQATQNRGESEAIMANARARGIGGSDLESVNRLIAQQGAATRGAAQGVNAAALAESRRMQALNDSTALAGNIRGADYSKAANEAGAADAINRFNAAAKQSQVNLNVGNANTAQAANLGAKQQIANQNVQQANQVPQQVIDNQLAKAGAKARAEVGVGAAKAGENQQTRTDIGNAVQLGGMFMMSDERCKKDVEPFDASSLLDDISGYKYKYKEGLGQPKGQMVGFMADDLQKEAPGAVKEGADGIKRVDVGQLGGIILAALADVNKDVQELKRARS